MGDVQIVAGSVWVRLTIRKPDGQTVQWLEQQVPAGSFWDEQFVPGTEIIGCRISVDAEFRATETNDGE